VEVLDQPILRTGRLPTLLQLLQMVSDASGRRKGSSKLSRERVRSMLLRCHLRHARRSSDVCWLKDGTYIQQLDPKPSNDACMSGNSASRHGRTTMVLIIATAAWGQVRDCIGLFEEDRIWILKLPWLAWLWKKAVTAACVMGFRWRPHEWARVFCSPAGV
jgi:hypothetical protein